MIGNGIDQQTYSLMSAGGSISAMNSSIKGNRALVKHKGYFNKRLEYQKALQDQNITYRTATKAELKEIRKRIKRQNKIDNYFKLIGYPMATIFAIWVIWEIFTLLNSTR